MRFVANSQACRLYYLLELDGRLGGVAVLIGGCFQHFTLAAPVADTDEERIRALGIALDAMREDGYTVCVV